MNRYYFLFVFGCTDPELSRPYKTARGRDRAAKRYWEENGSETDGIFRAMTNIDGVLSVSPFISGELDNDE